jgi:hypothetical protein
MSPPVAVLTVVRVLRALLRLHTHLVGPLMSLGLDVWVSLL